MKTETKRQTTIELDAEPIAKLRAMLRALGNRWTIQDVIMEFLGEVIEKEPREHYLAEGVFGDDWEAHPKRNKMIAKLKRCRDGDKRLVRPEPLPRNVSVDDETLERIERGIAAGYAPEGFTPESVAAQLAIYAAAKFEAGNLKLKPKQG